MKSHLLFVAALCVGFAAAAETIQLKPKKLAEVAGGDGKTYRIEDLGNPMTPKPSEIEFVSTGPKGEKIAWTISSAPDRNGMLGIDVATGETHWIDITADFGPHSNGGELAPHGNDAIYIISGDRFKIYKYTISTRQVKLLHTYPQATGRSFFHHRAVGPDGKIYVGTYPRTIAIGVDPATDRAFELPPIATDKAQRYLNALAVDDDNVMYAPIGRSKPELFALNLNTGVKKQILTPEEIKALIAENTYIPSVYLHQGKVYTTIADQRYLCTPSGLQKADNAIPWPDHIGRIRANGRFPDRKINATETAVEFGARGLVVVSGDQKREIPVDFEPSRHEIYRFGDLRKGVLFGGGIFPAKAFGIDLATLTATDYGRCSTGSTQKYALLDTPKGLLISSYTGAALDLFNPDLPKEKGNPRNLAVLEITNQQERIPRLTKVNDHIVYGGTIPIKSQLNGAVVKVDLRDDSVKVFRGVLPDQSINDLVLCPDGKTLFGNGSILGGTSATPTLKAADFFLWDTATDKVIWTGKAFDDAIFYTESGVTGDGNIISFGRTGSNAKPKLYYCFVFDPETREVVFRHQIPGTFKRYLIAHPEPMGPEKLNYFAADGTLYAYDPAKKAVRKIFSHPTLEISQDLTVLPDGYLYYLNHNATIARVKLF